MMGRNRHLYGVYYNTPEMGRKIGDVIESGRS